MIQVQLPLHGLDYGGKEDTKTVNDGVLVYSTHKFIRIVLSCKDREEYRRVEVKAYLVGRWSANGQDRADCEARKAQTDPDPCDVGV